jgi:YetA-like protein
MNIRLNPRWNALSPTRGLAGAATSRSPVRDREVAAPSLIFLVLWTTLLVPARADDITLNWLGDAPPGTAAGVSWGVPFPKGAVQKSQSFTLATAAGKILPLQSWPLAYWPDGTIKWGGFATIAEAQAAGPFKLSPGAGAAGTEAAVRVTESAAAVDIDTGHLTCHIARTGAYIFDSLAVDGRVVSQQARLICIRQDGPDSGTMDVHRETYGSAVQKVTVEQSGPVRAVVKIEGLHQLEGGGRAWLPFVVRLYFYAGAEPVRLVHSFVFDGDGNKDFVKGLGLSFTVPLKEELHNRHIRFVGDGDGVWAQPVRMLPGYRAQAGQKIADLYASHLGGQRVPNLADLDERTRSAILTVPVWGDAKLTQLGPNGFSINKRTTADSSWLHVTDGHRARGLAVLADVSGGIAVGVKNFWQKYPASIEITHGATAAGELKVWLWSPEGPAMDLRHYDTGPHGLGTNYEDWKPGWSTPEGIANTADLTLWAFGAIPSDAQLVTMAKAASEPPMLVSTPEYYHSLQVFGHWSLPNRSTPAFRQVEEQVAGLVNFYEGQVDERSWYGYWDFGDIMHNYDFGRHEWRYDVGGWAWANTELMPDMLLWFTFLRTGRADIFRMAEAMTRHTSEVDVYHVGPFAPLGSRHNVNHWGDGAKQPRISHSGLKQFYYFLTTDERVGDLMREQLTADVTYGKLSKFNGAHYIPLADGTYRLDNQNQPPAPRPEDFKLLPAAATTQNLGLEWMCYAMNWMVEYERTGDVKWRDRVLTDMHTMAAGVKDGKLPGRYFDMIFGGPENMWEIEPMFDVPEFWRAWTNTSEAVGRQVTGGEMTGPRMLAYAAYVKKDPELGRLAWEKLIGKTAYTSPQPVKVTGANVVKPVTDPAFLGAPVGWQLHGVASVQWALNAIETMELARDYAPDVAGVADPGPASPRPATAP